MNCSHCGKQSKYDVIVYHKLLGMDLCPRCTDKLLSLINDKNVNEFWTNEYAMSRGYEPFPMPSKYKLEYLKERVKLMKHVCILDYRYKKGSDI